MIPQTLCNLKNITAKMCSMKLTMKLCRKRGEFQVVFRVRLYLVTDSGTFF